MLVCALRKPCGGQFLFGHPFGLLKGEEQKAFRRVFDVNAAETMGSPNASVLSETAGARGQISRNLANGLITWPAQTGEDRIFTGGRRKARRFSVFGSNLDTPLASKPREGRLEMSSCPNLVRRQAGPSQGWMIGATRWSRKTLRRPPTEES